MGCCDIRSRKEDHIPQELDAACKKPAAGCVGWVGGGVESQTVQLYSDGPRRA